MAAPTELSHFTSADGLVLDYITYGDASSPQVVFFHHGLPGSHLEASIFHATALSQKIRLVSIDRPGMGGSTFQANFRLLDWPAKLTALADHLEVGAFAVLGVSGGGPYVLACLHELPRTRCIGGGIIAGVYPSTLGWQGMAFETRSLFALGSWSPWLVEKTLEYVLGSIARDREHPEKLEEFLGKTFKSRPEADRAVWDADEGGIRTMLIEDSRIAAKNGSKGAAWETYLVAQDWGFQLQDVATERLVMWHGALDANWPVPMARKAEELIRGAELRVLEADGHVSTFAKTVCEVMTTMGEILSAS